MSDARETEMREILEYLRGDRLVVELRGEHREAAVAGEERLRAQREKIAAEHAAVVDRLTAERDAIDAAIKDPEKHLYYDPACRIVRRIMKAEAARDEATKWARRWKALAKLLHADEIHCVRDHMGQRSRVAVSRSATIRAWQDAKTADPSPTCSACREQPEAVAPCPCDHAPCIHDRNATIAQLRAELSEQVTRDHAMMTDMRDDWERALGRARHVIDAVATALLGDGKTYEPDELPRHVRALKRAKAENDDRFMLERDAARAEVERSRKALDAIGEIMFDTMVRDSHVEHVVRYHSSEIVGYFRFLATQLQKIDAICSAFFEPILSAMEERAEKETKEPYLSGFFPSYPS